MLTKLQINNQVPDPVWPQVYGPGEAQVEVQIKFEVLVQVWHQVRVPAEDQVSALLVGQLKESL